MCTNAQANLLSFTPNQVSYNAGDTVLIDIFVNNINPEAAEFEFDLGFDNLALTYNLFTFDDSVFFSAVTSEADVFSVGTISFFTSWFDEADVPGPNFRLGQISFTALTANTPNLIVSNLYLADDNFNEVTPHPSVTVPLPSSALLILMALAVFTLRKQTQLNM
jgi:hypothetical protein